MVNDGELGGLCILRGCMPTKAMLASAHAVAGPRHASELGVEFEGVMVPDFTKIMARKDAQVARFKRAKIASIEAAAYEVIDARARFVAGGGLDIGGRVLTARSYVIATGSKAYALPIPGLDEVEWLSSDGVMRLSEQPASIVVQGAGPIGLEMVQFFSGIGTKVLLVNRSGLLSHFDDDCGRELRAALEEDRNIQMAVPGRIDSVERAAGGLRFQITSGDQAFEHHAEKLLVATGRAAALDDLGLEHVGVQVERGRVTADEHLATTNERIYVAGDATGTYQILHLANFEGAVAGHNAARGKERTIDYRLACGVTFTDPPFATAGLTQKSAKASGRAVVVAAVKFAETGRAITMGTHHGMWKLVADAATGEILGTSIVGPRADDLMHLVTTLMHFRGTVDDLGVMPWYHPTLSEVMKDLERGIRAQMER